MTPLAALWLPILLSAVIVFAVSSIIHMVLPWHRNDFRRLEKEDAVMSALRPFNVPPGDYIVPCPTGPASLRSPEFLEKRSKGPAFMMTMFPTGPVSMGKPLALWFVYDLVVSLFAAYVAGRALQPGTQYLQVFRFAGVTAFLGYALASWQAVIWYQRSVPTTIKTTIDGLIYALLTAGVFGWLWPR